MAGIAIVMDLLRKNPSLTGRTVHSYGLFSAKVAASAAATSAAAMAPFATWAFFGKGVPQVAFCDAGAAINGDYISSIRSASENVFEEEDSVDYSTKEYIIELKPLFSAFHWKTLALTSLRSFLLFYLPLLEPHANMDDDDDDFLQDTHEERVDLVVPFKKSVKQIVRETTVVTTRRILERLAVHYVSQRLAWKLLKDTPKSAARKAQRGMPTLTYIYSVGRTTFRGHFLGVLASWLVQVGIDAYRFFSRFYGSKEETDEVDRAAELQFLGRKIYIATLRCGASLIFASIGAGLGAILIRPTTGQWIGCALGDLAGPVILSLCFEKLFHVEL